MLCVRCFQWSNYKKITVNIEINEFMLIFQMFYGIMYQVDRPTINGGMFTTIERLLSNLRKKLGILF